MKIQIPLKTMMVMVMLGLSENLHAVIEQPDSLSSTLKEVVVEGSTQHVIKYGVEYTPGKKVKKAAQDALSLLFYMQIPQVNVSPIDLSVTTLSGSGMNIFIDYVPATSADLQGLRSEDVLRVEVLEYPQDPRFQGAPHVVNFRMRRYEWGGYTKLSALGQTLNDNYIQGNVYQKFAYKGWIFDVSASASGTWERKYRDHSVETFRDIYIDGAHYDELSRTSATTGYRGCRNSENASIGEYISTMAHISAIHSPFHAVESLRQQNILP